MADLHAMFSLDSSSLARALAIPTPRIYAVLDRPFLLLEKNFHKKTRTETKDQEKYKGTISRATQDASDSAIAER